MIKRKEKPCKGIGKAIGHGCGEPVMKRINGLCQRCYGKFIANDTGKIERAIEKARRIREAAEKKMEKERKVELMSTTAYWSKIVQPVFNEIARLIDRKFPCIATGRYCDKPHGGHYISVGANRTISLNLHNIHLQSLESNHFQSGDSLRYREGLLNRYGAEYVEFVESLKSCQPLKLSKCELVQIFEKAKKVRAMLREQDGLSLPEGLIAARNMVNETMGIYPEKYSVFTK